MGLLLQIIGFVLAIISLLCSLNILFVNIENSYALYFLIVGMLFIQIGRKIYKNR